MKLKPCPFCNSEVKIMPAEKAYAWIDNSQGSPDYNGQFVIDHLELDKQRAGCVWHGSVVIWEPTIEKAILTWNTREGNRPKVESKPLGPVPRCCYCGMSSEYAVPYRVENGKIMP